MDKGKSENTKGIQDIHVRKLPILLVIKSESLSGTQFSWELEKSKEILL